jgi:hypothetical protein
MTKQNNCSPARIYGGFEQTLFLGLSVMSFSASIGWNGQQSEVTIQLVYDPDDCDLTKVYYDSLLIRRELTGPDPGFTNPTVGSPQYFRVAEFEYMGLLQSVEKRDSPDGKNIFTVKLIDPTEILAGTKIITGDYAGGVNNIPNIINAYGFAESFGKACPLTYVLGSPFGSPANAFGGSQTNDLGMPWYLIQESISLLTSSIPRIANKFSPYGRLVFRASNVSNGRYGSVLADELDAVIPYTFTGHSGYVSHYFIDLSDLPLAPDYYRIPGPDISLLDAITQLCDDAGFDFYIELIPVILGSSVIKIIKVRTVDRGLQPPLGTIAAFVGDSDGTMNSSIGNELRNEVTSALLVGEQQDNIYQAVNTNLIEQYWGLDLDNNVIEVQHGGKGDYIELSILKLNELLHNPLDATVVHLYIHEMKAALAGQDSFEAITDYLKDHDNNVFGKYIDDLFGADGWAGALDLAELKKVFEGFVVPGGAIAVPAGWVFNPKRKTAVVQKVDNLKLVEDLDSIFNFVVDYARTYLDKKYMVRLPYTCSIRESETQVIKSTEHPTTSGWTEERTIISLAHPTLTDLFSEENGKIQCFVKATISESEEPKPFDLDELRGENYLIIQTGDEGNDETTTSNLFVPATVDSEVVFSDYELQYSPRAVITLNQPIYRRDDLPNQFSPWALLTWFYLVVLEGKPAADAKKFIEESHGTEYTYAGLVRDGVKPVAAAIPMHSNVLTYGPWSSLGPPGKSEFKKDPSFAPWEYGSNNAMNIAGQYDVDTLVTYMQVGEMGSISVPGYPSLNLGAELRSGAATAVETRRILTSQGRLPLRELNKKGSWNASTNTPALTSGIGDNGDYYKVSSDGSTDLDGNTSWSKGDTLLFNNGTWSKQEVNDSAYMSTDRLDTPVWRGLYGPNITNIDCEVGAGGISTNYSMRSFTPVRGRFSRANAERMKRLGQQELQIKRASRLSQLNFHILLAGQTDNVRSQIIKNIRSGKLGNPLSVKRGGTPVNVITGMLCERQSNNRDYADVGINKISHLNNELNDESYPHKAMMSLDGLLRPVSRFGDGDLPQYSQYAIPLPFTTAPEPPLDGDTSYIPPSVGREEIDPLQDGHDIALLARSDEVPTNGMIIPFDDYAEDYRFFALKGPIVYQAWGLDTNNKPIPNRADVENDAEEGIFALNGLKDEFLIGYLQKSKTWPVGPIDLRFDRTRGVWTVPPAYRIVTVKLTEAMPKVENNLGMPSKGYIVDGNPLENAEGTPYTNGGDKTVKVLPISLKQRAAIGDRIMAYYDTVDMSYKAIEVPSTGILAIRFTLTSDMVDGEATATINASTTGAHIGQVVTVYDMNNTHQVALIGAKGTAISSGGLDDFLVIDCEQVALFAEANAAESICETSTGVVTIYDFAIFPTAPFNQAPAELPTIAYNTCGHMIKNLDKLLLRRFDNIVDAWQIVDVQKHKVKMITDVYPVFDTEGDGHLLRIDQQWGYVAVELCTEPATVDTVVEFEECEEVTPP